MDTTLVELGVGAAHHLPSTFILLLGRMHYVVGCTRVAMMSYTRLVAMNDAVYFVFWALVGIDAPHEKRRRRFHNSFLGGSSTILMTYHITYRQARTTAAVLQESCCCRGL